MYLTPEQRGYAMMGLDVFASNRQGASIKGPLWPGGVLVYDIAPALGKKPSNSFLQSNTCTLGITGPSTLARTNQLTTNFDVHL